MDGTRQVPVKPRIGENEKLLDNINAFVSNIENKTEGLFDIDKEIGVKIKTFSNAKNSLNNYMIQKEKEKLTIVPMIPVKMNQASYNKTILNPQDSSKDVYYYDYEDQKNREKSSEVINRYNRIFQNSLYICEIFFCQVIFK